MMGAHDLLRNIFKKTISVSLVSTMMFCTAGCSGNVDVPERHTDPASSAVSENLPAESASSDPGVAPSPQHITQTISADLSIDADVVGYPADGVAGIYAGEPKRFTKEEMQNFFRICGTEIASSQDRSVPDIEYYNGTCENGAVFFYQWDTNGHPYSQFIYRHDQKSEYYHAYPIYAGEDYYLVNAKYMVGWMFTEPKEFAFATASEAEQAVRTALEALGLADLELLRTLYCDHQTLDAAMHRITTHADYGPLGETVENNGYPIKESWTADDDAYVFSFGISVEGVPMSYRHNDSSRTAWYTGSEIVAWYTRDGIINLTIETPWQVGEEESSPATIIPAKTALEVATEKLENDLLPEDQRIDEIRLEYHYVQNLERWLLTPVWSVAYSHRSGPDTDRVYNYVLVDAFTGEEW